MSTSYRQWLPPTLRPRRALVRRRWWIGIAVAVGIGIGAVYALVSARSVRADQALWARGLEATDARVHGQVDGDSNYELTVRYVDQTGVTHTGFVELSLLTDAIEDGDEVSVRYDPNQPSEFVLSWSVEHASWRYANLGAVAVGVAGTALFVGALFWRRDRKVFASARRPRLVALDLSASQWNHNLQNRYHRVDYVPVHVGPDGRRHRPLAARPRSLRCDEAPPIFLDAEHTRVLAVSSGKRPGEPILVRSNLYPFEATERDVERLREQLAAEGLPHYERWVDVPLPTG